MEEKIKSTLSDKIEKMYDDTTYNEDTFMIDVKDVREFIKQLKEKLPKAVDEIKAYVCSVDDLIDELAGKELCE